MTINRYLAVIILSFMFTVNMQVLIENGNLMLAQICSEWVFDCLAFSAIYFFLKGRD